MKLIQSTDAKLTRPEAAEYIGVAPRTLANWHSSGRVKIPFYKVGKKKTIYLKSDLDMYMDSVRQS
ncbi:MAG: helix-turn-helix domain-containing protein [Hafnia paralvei]|jgi:excisionase family DNA binding protein|uniref:DNA binding domain-containing protein, excisionase family n=1 Tax=Hafnia alvei TaxID=569 RepID=A0A1C6YVV1_HAFAL|nr:MULTISPECIES: helix-turn-helix domain-containing protein [Hafnia]MCE9908853.1 helix-turn-helix domain-containing protein [Hafnia paralvei]NLS56230.1 helix-turn-helix domain-containing protein [Hafnia alvei]NUN40854.1 helix-turn-helix domain-containing protein [Hafnia paralvei]TBM29526.1 DNA-binding protein [Hafnia paralvei]SCM50983.1 DNA binding domain-containing protein, excisionase family [Hafnia alvei]